MTSLIVFLAVLIAGIVLLARREGKASIAIGALLLLFGGYGLLTYFL